MLWEEVLERFLDLTERVCDPDLFSILSVDIQSVKLSIDTSHYASGDNTEVYVFISQEIYFVSRSVFDDQGNSLTLANLFEVVDVALEGHLLSFSPGDDLSRNPCDR